MMSQKGQQGEALSSRVALRSCEGWAWWVFALSTAFTAFGPIVHYLGWPLALALLLLQRFIQGTSLKMKFPGDGKKLMILALMLCAWSIVGSVLTATNVISWGRGVSFFFELAAGLWLTARLNQQEEDRRMLLRLFLWGAVLSALYFTLQELSVVSGINKSLRNGNSLGFLGLFVSMLLWEFSLSSSSLSDWFRPVLFTLGGAILFLSFSSGAWIAGVFQFVVILCYSSRRRRTARWVVALSIALGLLCLMGVDSYTKGHTRQLLFRELSQMTSFNDLNSLTTSRKDIWIVSLKMIGEHPITGHGQRFEDAYRDYVAQRNPDVTVKEASHPHNTWLFVLFQAGIPGLLILILFAGALLRKSWNVMKTASGVDRRWALLSVTFLVGQVFYSTNGDLFQGRRDVTVLAWALFGVIAVLPTRAKKSREEE